MALRRRVMVRFILAALIMPVILFSLAGSLHYWQGWLYYAVLMVPMLAAAGYFLKSDPQFLERRMKFREREPEQRPIVSLGNAVLAAGTLAIAYDLRWNGLDQLPSQIIIAADAGVLLGYCLILWVFRENSYASRTVEVVEGQRVITTGPYSIICHPMYLGILIMFLLTPIALGSFFVLPVFFIYIPVIAVRIINEEKVLLRDLPVYSEYCMAKPYLLMPYFIVIPRCLHGG
jgi:protein-S-isoprenylcysteine O-methyltransferase Ste14